jgi:hypothetical protein
VIGNFANFCPLLAFDTRKLALLFGFNRGIPSFYAARRFDELSRESVSCLSFEKQFHNATTRLQVTVIGHGIGGKYIPIMARLAKARHWSKR